MGFFLFGLLILKKNCTFIIFIEDRNQTDLRRIKPNSRMILTNEQFDPLLRLRNKDITNRHRGDKLKCR